LVSGEWGFDLDFIVPNPAMPHYVACFLAKGWCRLDAVAI